MLEVADALKQVRYQDLIAARRAPPAPRRSPCASRERRVPVHGRPTASNGTENSGYMDTPGGTLCVGQHKVPGKRPAGFGERGEETCLWDSDCGPVRKRRMSHRTPPGYAPPLDSTCAAKRRHSSAGANPARQTVAPAGNSRSG